MSRVFFYRDSSAIGAAVQTDVNLDHKPVGRSVRGGFFFVDQAPGQHEIETKTEWEHDTSIALEPGSTHYVRSYVTIGVLVGHIRTEEKPAEEAKAIIDELAYIGSPLGLPNAATPAVMATADTGKLSDGIALKPAEQSSDAPQAGKLLSLTVADSPTTAPAQQRGAKANLPEGTATAPVMEQQAQADVQAKVDGQATTVQQVAVATPSPAVAAPIASMPMNQSHTAVSKVLGQWSYDVEQLARAQSCEGDGAWLIRQDLSVETYQVDCHSGVAFYAVCEKHGCKQAS
jgi:hypothetical protein